MHCPLQNCTKKYNEVSFLSSHLSRCLNLKEYRYDELHQNGNEEQLESDADMTVEQFDEL